ncbi:MAG TPA: aminopeptidase [Longimicrobiales bacterium]|nr:aminopeptidase [Longimicrobiales bacterium]
MTRVLTVLLLGAGLAGCSPVYVVRAGIEEARILSRRRPITEVIRDPVTDSTTRRKLELVLQARDFSDRVLRLGAGDSYTTYSYVDSDTLLLVVSASRSDRFEAYTWWFPIVGRVPYKGFFDFDDAHRAAARLERRGYDTYVRPSGAFSTLGWFNDPLLNTVLRYDDVALAGTVIHEILHNSIYLPSRVSFNESFANFVGERGVAEFFCTRDGENSPRCTLARDNWQDNLRFAAFLSALVAELEHVYGRTDIDAPRKLELRHEIFERARRNFTDVIEPQLRTGAYRGFARRPINNATLIGTRLYYDRLALFEAVYQHWGGDFVAAVHAIMAAARANPDDPYGATAALLSAPRPSGAPPPPRLD